MCKSTPPITIWPLLGFVRPVSTPNKVDFPAPDGPTIAVSVRGQRLNETSCSRGLSPIEKLISRADIEVPFIPSKI